MREEAFLKKHFPLITTAAFAAFGALLLIYVELSIFPRRSSVRLQSVPAGKEFERAFRYPPTVSFFNIPFYFYLPPLTALILACFALFQASRLAIPFALLFFSTWSYAYGVCEILKVYCPAARPLYHGEPISEITGALRQFAISYKMSQRCFSFPSGHSAVAFAGAASTAICTFALLREGKFRFTWVASIATLAVGLAGAAVVGWSRIYDCHHHLSDVFWGATIGVLVSLSIAGVSLYASITKSHKGGE